MTSGCVDAISFLALGQVFTAAMTGNTVLFGLALSHPTGLSAMRYAVALFGFMLGAAVASIMVMRSRKITGWSPVVTVTVWVELAALVLFAILVNTLSAHAIQGASDVLILILAFAMGVQGVAARRIGVNAVTTTVITSTLTGLMETLVWKTGEGMRRPLAVAQNETSAKQSGGSTASVTAILMWISVIVFYGVGAGLCGVIELHVAFQAIWLPIGLVLAVLVTDAVARIYATRHRQVSQSQVMM